MQALTISQKAGRLRAFRIAPECSDAYLFAATSSVILITPVSVLNRAELPGPCRPSGVDFSFNNEAKNGACRFQAPTCATCWERRAALRLFRPRLAGPCILYQQKVFACAANRGSPSHSSAIRPPPAGWNDDEIFVNIALCTQRAGKPFAKVTLFVADNVSARRKQHEMGQKGSVSQACPGPVWNRSQAYEE